MAASINWYDLTAQQTSPAAQPAQPAADKTVSRDTFLKLLVAQIRNQNPLSPADGIQFLTQLAQFTELEQLIGMRQDLETIRDSLAAAGGAPAGQTRGSQGD
jgi:flagellar basal-body rod modification protein FlgD